MARRLECVGRIGPLLAVLVFGAAGCGDGGPGGGSEGGEQSREAEPVPGEVVCGGLFALPSADGPLRLSGRFATSVPAGRPAVKGTVEVTSRDAVRGVGAPVADAFVVREGRVVAVPLAQDAIGVRWDLAAGEMRTLAATAALTACAPGGGPLAPALYELYARVILTPDDAEPRPSFGGPWPLRVR